MTYVLEIKPRVTFLVIGDSLVLWNNNTYKKTRTCRSLLQQVC